eukprot:6660114-Prorocentrum_lima.AAC.1
MGRFQYYQSWTNQVTYVLNTDSKEGCKWDMDYIPHNSNHKTIWHTICLRGQMIQIQQFNSG